MASSALDEMFEEIEGLLEAQHSLSARWYARHSGMPVDEARATLEAYLKKRGKGKASATFLLGGTPASGGGQAFKLASAAALDGVKAGFSTITTEQLYSLHAPAMPDGDALPLAAIATAQDKSLYEQLLTKGGTNCMLDNRWSAIQSEAATISEPGARIKPAELPTNAVAPKSAAAAVTPKRPALPKEAAAMFASKPKAAAEKPGGKATAASQAPAKPIAKPNAIPVKPAAAPAPPPAAAPAAAAPAPVAGKKRRAIQSDDEDETGSPLAVKRSSPAPAAAASASKKKADQDETGAAAKAAGPPAPAGAAARAEAPVQSKAGSMAAMFGGRTAANGAAKPKGPPPGTGPKAPPTGTLPQAAPADRAAEAGTAVAGEGANGGGTGAGSVATEGAEKEVFMARGMAGAAGDAGTGVEGNGVKRGAEAAAEEEAERKKRKEERRKARIAEDAATLDDDPGSLLHPFPAQAPVQSPAAPSPGVALQTPQQGAGANADAAGGAPSRTRTITVKERVREEVTYMDDRGYMICEERWVEKEVEKEVPDVPTEPLKPVPGCAGPKPAPKPAAAKNTGAKNSGASKGGKLSGPPADDDDSDDDDAKPKAKKGAAKPKPKAAANAGMRSIGSFFGKK